MNQPQSPSQPAPSQPAPSQPDKVEGEGSYTAARDYDKSVRKFVESGQADAAAKDAEQALDGAEREELERAPSVKV